MAMCVYKYLFNNHVIGWEGGQARIQVFIKEGVLYLRGVGGLPMSLAGPGQRPRGEGQGQIPLKLLGIRNLRSL